MGVIYFMCSEKRLVGESLSREERPVISEERCKARGSVWPQYKHTTLQCFKLIFLSQNNIMEIRASFLPAIFGLMLERALLASDLEMVTCIQD